MARRRPTARIKAYQGAKTGTRKNDRPELPSSKRQSCQGKNLNNNHDLVSAALEQAGRVFDSIM